MFPCMTRKGCPETVLKPGTKGFCPLWKVTNFIERNPQTQETRALTGCFFDISIQMTEHCVRSTNRPVEEVHAMRKDIINGLTGGLELVLNKTLEAVDKKEQLRLVKP